MTEAKKTTKKKVARKKPAPKVELVSYSMRMVIPIGQYANIQPEIVIKAGSVDEAHNYIAPHMNKLWKEYYLVSERRPKPPEPVAKPAPVEKPVAEPVSVQPPDSSVALVKATQAINSCLSIDALNIITEQIKVSVKLSQDDKAVLIPLWEAKLLELNGK